MPIRWLAYQFRRIASELRKGRYEAVAREQEWAVHRRLLTERRNFERAVREIDALKRVAATGLAATPWARELIVELLEQRLRAIPGCLDVSAADARVEAA